MRYLKQIIDSIYGKRKFALLVLCLSGCLHFLGCVKNDKLSSPQEGSIYMPQAYQDRATLSLFKLDTIQPINFGVAYGGFKSASTDITATFKVDTSLITKYNSDNAYLGNTYVALPDTSYKIPSLTTTLKTGTTTSEPLSILLNTSKLSLGVHYLLPVRLVSISPGTFDTSLSIAYFKIDTLNTRARDITNKNTIFTFNYDDAPSHNDAGESATHFVDSNYSTKYLLFNYHTDMYTQLQFPTPTVINAYTLTSGNDAQERDPKNWNLAGSNDGANWTIIDTRTNQSFPNRTQTIQFNTSNNSAYTYYRLNITANNNNNTGLFQCTEWRLLQFY